MGTKFSIAAEDFNNLLKRAFVGSMRKALEDGFEEVVHSTNQDSSNAVVHWMLGAGDGSNASRRAMAAPTDLRATVKGGQKHPWVGRRGEHRSGSGVAIAVADQVLAREVKVAIEKYVRGNAPPTEFYFYNPFLDFEKYASRAGLESAAAAGVLRTFAVFEREISNPDVGERMRPLK